ncbi:DUF819 family protein [Lysobacter sp. Root983]|uniref:DUF819 family protein n=1 Tax=Lysobacter sp. Root983 TaxID=1736613 RepID=UPI00070F8FD3|nr:DUF819 family protein [Lysobacter sp. Root983]KRD80439.1 hypothetical protein ASE43_06215 [Lysobacter sp. Root983]
MIETVWPYLAVVLLAAGLFPSLERRYGWRLFSVLPPIVLTYLLVTALAVAGLWQGTAEIAAAQRHLTTQLLPALLFLLMVGCDLRAILALGPRMLAVFACAMASILVAIVLAYLIFRNALPADGWKMLAALSATWTGGSANLVAVKQSIGLPDNLLPPVLLADALCYSVWVVLLFSAVRFAPRFNRWTRADERALPMAAAPLAHGPASAGGVLLWLGIALLVGNGAMALAAQLPTQGFLTGTAWTVLIATVAGLALARTPLARSPVPAPLAGALLACLVAVLASQSNFAGMSAAPLFLLVGFTVLVLHVALFALAARAFRFDLYLCGISSLAQIGGMATAPVLAATYSRALVPAAVLLAMLGLVLGTGIGLFMAGVLSGLSPTGV